MDCAEAFIRQQWKVHLVLQFGLNKKVRRFCVSNVLESCKSDVDFFNLRVDPWPCGLVFES